MSNPEASTAEPVRPAVACTLEGGAEAIEARIGEWRTVLAAATSRESVAGGVTLVFDHDPATAVELARLAAAEAACCAFFTFTLTVRPAELRFTVTAPDGAGEMVDVIFGETR